MATNIRRATRPEAGDQARTKAPDRPNRKASAILSAARGLFLERGFDTITMDMVTRESGVSKATLYVHFNSKEELFNAVLGEEARRITDEVWKAAEAEKDDNEDVDAVLRRVARNFIDIFLTERTIVMLRAVIGALPHFPELGRTIFDAGPKILTERLAGFLAAAHDRGALHVPNAELAARQFLSLVRGDIDLRGILSLDLPTPAEIDEQIVTGIALFKRFHSLPRREG
ncbi:MAG: TetR/AcrR family transcriptional regulator [Mesorhizobium sp.]|uniref:TetR/AcrR family transcriptional regulator n=1 Tax=Mesorhizobium sp. TaxID=1871066 RepID=UPI000FE572EC|nr:TetR/AcrR family transcriptional regulator [Mesorhizobium sp.]RWH94065.1 MAG: TetR/AcrR family transcriptional regulator [Mesorhizobium sp.]RWK82695.1 MAG: TetR/AcrR family transcriptional regulator [Mesorhizobium sp.]RWL06502.1 MAG: TetR/AcrR family transcriptional regulator [Mesorhizobium sp.]